MVAYFAVNGKGGDKSVLSPGQLVRFQGSLAGSFEGMEARIVSRKQPVQDERGKWHDVYIVQLGANKNLHPHSHSLVVTTRGQLVPVGKKVDKE